MPGLPATRPSSWIAFSGGREMPRAELMSGISPVMSFSTTGQTKRLFARPNAMRGNRSSAALRLHAAQRCVESRLVSSALYGSRLAASPDRSRATASAA